MAAKTEAIKPMEGFLFGCDPELFIKDSEGRPVSPVGLIPGTKEEPFKVEHGAIQRDGMAAEFNIDPARDFNEFNRNINAVMAQLKAMLPKGLTFHIVPSVIFDTPTWLKVPDEAKELGCSPDFNAWTGQLNAPPNPIHPTMRCAGGHIHIGWTDNARMDDPQHIANCRDLVRQLDWFVGGWSIKKDHDKARRKLYGRAGACRYKPYGVEYRVLSNFWIKSTATRLETWNRVQAAIHGMRDMFLPDRGSFLNKHLTSSIDNSKMSGKLQGIPFPFETIEQSANTYW